MLRCWDLTPAKRPSFKEIWMFLNNQLQKLSKTVSSINSLTSTNSHNEINKKSGEKLLLKRSIDYEEADDENSAGTAFLNVNEKDNGLLRDLGSSSGNNTHLINNNKRLSYNKKLSEKMMDTSENDSQYFSGTGDDTCSITLNHDGSENKSNKTESNENSDGSTNNNKTEIDIHGYLNKLNSDHETMTDSNYESASSYYSTIAPNKTSKNTNSDDNNNNNNRNEKRSSFSDNHGPDSANNSIDSPLLSTKNQLNHVNNNNNNTNNSKYKNELVTKYTEIDNNNNNSKSKAKSRIPTLTENYVH